MPNLHPVEDIDRLDHVPCVGGGTFDTEQLLPEHRHSFLDWEDNILKGPCRGTYVQSPQLELPASVIVISQYEVDVRDIAVRISPTTRRSHRWGLRG